MRFGPGVVQEIGMDFASIKAKNIAVFTDANARNTRCMAAPSPPPRSASWM